MNLDKNTLTKVYSINYYPNNIELQEIKTFYKFDIEMNTFSRIVTEIKKFTPDIHAFYLNYNYKKYMPH